KYDSPLSTGLKSPVAALVSTSDKQLADKVNDITSFHTALEPRLWSGMALRSDVRQGAEKLGNMIAGQLDIAGISIKDIVVLGSIASYEYDENADFDLQIYLDTAKYTGDIDWLKKYLSYFTSTI